MRAIWRLLFVLVGVGTLSSCTTPGGDARPATSVAVSPQADVTVTVPLAQTSEPTATSSPSIIASCADTNLVGTAVQFVDPDGETLQGMILGTGRAGVVLSNQSSNDPCPWLPFARTLLDNGVQVLLYTYGSGNSAQEALAAAAVLEKQGVERIILVGASQGAMATVEASSQNPRQIVAAVALSPGLISNGRELTRFAAQLTLPVLFVTAEQDADSSQTTPLFYQKAPSTDKHLLSVPGTAHGYDLLQDADVASQVLTFITDYADTRR